MPTQKIAELPADRTCRDPEHNPPTHVVYTPGLWEHICPRCNARMTFTVDRGLTL